MPGRDVNYSGVDAALGLELSETICATRHLPPTMQRSTWSLADFSLQKELHKGKHTALYLATDRATGTRLVLKLHRKHKMGTLTRHQTTREVQLHSRLDHERVLRLYAAFEGDKYVGMVLEHAEGGDLFARLKRCGGQMGERQAVDEVLRPLLGVLVHLHSQGIIHRDIKPENVLFTSDNNIRLADFGLAIDASQERPVTRAGTLDYLAPEVARCPDKALPEHNKELNHLVYTAKVDCWAVGVLAYELLVGSPPFEHDCPVATTQSILGDAAKLPQWMSDDARDFIHQALRKDAASRPSAAELALHPWIQRSAQPLQQQQQQQQPKATQWAQRQERQPQMPPSEPADGPESPSECWPSEWLELPDRSQGPGPRDTDLGVQRTSSSSCSSERTVEAAATAPASGKPGPAAAAGTAAFLGKILPMDRLLAVMQQSSQDQQRHKDNVQRQQQQQQRQQQQPQQQRQQWTCVPATLAASPSRNARSSQTEGGRLLPMSLQQPAAELTQGGCDAGGLANASVNATLKPRAAACLPVGS